MIELLILYLLNSRDKTIYALRRDILERFDSITKPSFGTIHPALKRLMAKDAVKQEHKYSEGGKKSSYYSITATGKKVFREIFFEEISQNPSLFYNQLSARLLTLSMLSKEDRDEFLSDLEKRLELQKINIQNDLNNEYIQYDEWQKAVINSTLASVAVFEELVSKLKNI